MIIIVDEMEINITSYVEFKVSSVLKHHVAQYEQLLINLIFFLWLREDFRKEFQEQNPDIKTMREVRQDCAHVINC